MRLDMQAALNLSHNPLVECSCGRTTNADMMRDVRPVKALIGTADDFQCDSCVESHHRTAKLSRAAYYAALKAPKALIDKMTRVDQMQAETRNVI